MPRPWETDPERYAALLDEKCARARQSLRAFDPPPAAVYPSPVESYRVRAEFRLWHEGDALDYVMFDPAAPRRPVRIADFAPALAPIRRLMGPLRACLAANETLRRKLFQAEFMASQQGEVLLTLIYHRALDQSWQREASRLADTFKLHLIGRSRGQKRVLSQDFIIDEFVVGERPYRYRQYEQSFVQPNAAVNARMLAWAVEQSRACDGNLLELYCGNGNFTLPLAAHFDTVIATEVSKSGIKAARENLADNAIHNVHVLRLSATEVSSAMAGARQFRRLAVLDKPLKDYRLRSVLVDPPRAGLDRATLECVRHFASILYISCNAQTLTANLEALHTTHRIAALAFFDQFPYTPHLECGLRLKRR